VGERGTSKELRAKIAVVGDKRAGSVGERDEGGSGSGEGSGRGGLVETSVVMMEGMLMTGRDMFVVSPTKASVKTLKPATGHALTHTAPRPPFL
jgi:hypothetical protein